MTPAQLRVLCDDLGFRCHYDRQYRTWYLTVVSLGANDGDVYWYGSSGELRATSRERMIEYIIRHEHGA